MRTTSDPDDASRNRKQSVPGEHLRKDYAHLDEGERRAKTPMRAAAEREVDIGGRRYS